MEKDKEEGEMKYPSLSPPPEYYTIKQLRKLLKEQSDENENKDAESIDD